MKKVAVIVQSKDARDTMGHLRSLGVVHLEHQQAPTGKDVTVINDDIALVEQVVNILSAEEFSVKFPMEIEKQYKDWKLISHHIIDLSKRFNQLKEYSITLKNKISYWQEWGDFNPETITALAKKEIFVRLYDIPKREIKKLPSDCIVKVVSTIRGVSHSVIISRRKIQILFREITLPNLGLDKMRQRLSEDSKAMDLIRTEACKHGCYLETLQQIKRSLEKDLEFQQALNGMGQSKNIAYLTGFVPYDAVDLLQEISERKKWGLMINDPGDEDIVPTLIRNPKWVSIISPIFKVIEIVPGYRELDISLWFLVFLSVFFGMLIGDAAYGLIFFMLTFWAQRKWGRRIKERSVFILLYLFSLCAIGWGVLSGTFFGQEWLPGFVKPIIPALRNDKSVQALCFFIGALHLSIGHLWRFIVKLPSFMALAEAGWIVILWGFFLLAKDFILGETWWPIWLWFVITGSILVILFTSFKKNIFKGIGVGFGNLLLNIVNSFTDVVSYIRLFAVGLATVAVADSFNKMAMEVGFGSVAAGALAVFVLFLGHTLNIILGPMSVLVHGVRLNVLEFCNHIDIKWSGFAYKPLRQ